ncbi:MAG: hypothetical protein ACKV2T_43145 [Kofleriaceae bacterium]
MTPDDLLTLLDTTEWQRRFVAVTHVEPGLADKDAVLHLLRTQGIDATWFVFDNLTPIERTLAEHYLPVLLRWELAYGTPRLGVGDARRAAEMFLSCFGPHTRFYATIGLTSDIVTAMETRAPVSYGTTGGVFGSTLESGVFAIDPRGVVGGIDIGDED